MVDDVGTETMTSRYRDLFRRILGQRLEIARRASPSNTSVTSSTSYVLYQPGINASSRMRLLANEDDVSRSM